MKELYKDRGWLYQKYWGENLTLERIAKICRVSLQTISNWMDKYKIIKRTQGEIFGGKIELYQNKNWLEQKYWKERLSTLQIGKLCKTSDDTIAHWMKKYGIKIRTLSEAQTKHGLFENKSWLYQKYWIEGLNTYEIGRICKVYSSTIRKQLNKNNIQIIQHAA